MRNPKYALSFKASVLIIISLIISGCASRQVSQRKNHIILVGHGVPASDYPKERLAKFFRMEVHEHSGQQHLKTSADIEREQLEREIRQWPRTSMNDPYKFGVDALAEHLSNQTNCPVSVAFNEFCAPTVQEAIDEAAQQGTNRIIVVSTMITPGGKHSEVDIPKSIADAKKQYANIEIEYVWPYDMDRIAKMLADEIYRLKKD